MKFKRLINPDLKKNATPAILETLESMLHTRSAFSISWASNDPTASSLEIPSKRLSFYNKRCTELGGRSAYFEWIVHNALPRLNKYRSELARRRSPKWKTNYQRQGLDLQKKNFTPDPVLWELFRNAAQGVGVSMCFLFVFLLEQDLEGSIKPTTPISKKPALAWNSMPKATEIPKKLGKFSIFWRLLEKTGRRLHRNTQE